MLDCKENKCEENRNECECSRDMRRQEMIDQIKCLDFTIIELGLYLDTHPDDKQMIELFNQYSRDAKTARDEFENKFGPLLVNSKEGFPWAWNNRPWPWEN